MKPTGLTHRRFRVELRHEQDNSFGQDNIVFAHHGVLCTDISNILVYLCRSVSRVVQSNSTFFYDSLFSSTYAPITARRAYCEENVQIITCTLCLHVSYFTGSLQNGTLGWIQPSSKSPSSSGKSHLSWGKGSLDWRKASNLRQMGI